MSSISPLRTLFHDDAAVSSILVTARVHDGAARRKTQILESFAFVPETSASEEMMDL